MEYLQVGLLQQHYSRYLAHGKRKQHVLGVSEETLYFTLIRGFPGGSDGKESACSAGGPGSIPRSRRSTHEGNGNPLQYSCLENSVD